MSKETTETTETAELQKPVKKEEIWSTEEKSKIKSQYGCEMLVENGSRQDVSLPEYPTDAYIVSYAVYESGKLGEDARTGLAGSERRGTAACRDNTCLRPYRDGPRNRCCHCLL